MKTDPYAAKLKHLNGMPSISKLQSLIENAWKEGFDEQGRDQLGGKLVNTRKWIGATEIAAFLLSVGIRVDVVDFQRPTANDGTHPKMFQWVLDFYKSRSNSYAPPLYFQHEGHSRTICGVEVMKNGQLRLLVFDPSCGNMSHILGGNDKNMGQVMKGLRKTLGSMKNQQYQIVAVKGVYNSIGEAKNDRVIRGVRIP